MPRLELRQCPFCEGKGVLLATERMLPSGPNRYYAECMSCLARGPVSSTRKYAIIKWNKERDEDA